MCGIWRDLHVRNLAREARFLPDRTDACLVSSGRRRAQYPFSPLYNENEFYGTARQSRIPAPESGHYEPPSDEGGRRAAAIYSLIATAKLAFVPRSRHCMTAAFQGRA
jgi:hypothetical protein